MIVCFSGTGNSLAVAKELQRCLGDSLMVLSRECLTSKTALSLAPDAGRVVWVAPVYCWGLPKPVVEVMRKADVSAGAEHYLVCTCGDDVGLAHRRWRKLMARRGWKAASAYSVQMPNTYVFMPGFDVDSPSLAVRKLAAMPERVGHVASRIARGAQGEDDVVTGGIPWIKTYVVYPLFMSMYTTPRFFSVSDACVGCSKCAADCPMGVIKMSGGRPGWSGDCAMCSRCYHRCPAHAIDYAGMAKHKGQCG